MLTSLRKHFVRDKVVDSNAQTWHQQYVRTPDIWKLEQFHRQLIFIPDDMMRGHRHHKLIAEASASGDDPFHPACYTLKPFTFWKKDLGTESFPIAMEESFKPSSFLRWPPEPARIKGELYAIRPRQIWEKLDIHRDNGVQFKRIRVPITLPYSQVKYSKQRPLPTITPEYVETVQAWMYVGVPEYWDEQLGGVFKTSELTLFEHDNPKPWIEKFYKFETI